MSKPLKPSVVAKHLGVAESTLARWRLRGTGPPYIKLGASKSSPVRYLDTDIESFKLTFTKGKQWNPPS